MPSKKQARGSAKASAGQEPPAKAPRRQAASGSGAVECSGCGLPSTQAAAEICNHTLFHGACDSNHTCA